MHGGVKFYRGPTRAARAYLERDRSRADEYYLAEGTGLAQRLTATPGGVVRAGSMDGDTYEHWVAGIDVETGARKGRLLKDERALRFVEVTVNGPKTWSLAAALHPDVAAALDAAQDKAAAEIIGWVASHATTRVGPRGRQVQVPVEKIEAAVIRHYTSRAGDPHRHLHLQINARVYAAGGWRGLHSVAVLDSIEAINGIGHAAVATDPGFRAALAAHGLTIDPVSGEVRELAPYVGAFSARTAQIRRNVERYEAQWRSEHRGAEPGPRLRETWDRRGWAEARPDKVVPRDGRELVERWNSELRDVGYRDPGHALSPELPEQVAPVGIPAGWVDRDAIADAAVSMLGARSSAWNAADLRGKAEVLLAQTGLVADSAVRIELAEDITARALARCTRLLTRNDAPEHVRALSSPRVLAVEAELIARLARPAAASDARRRTRSVGRARIGARGLDRIDPTQAAVVGALVGDSQLVVVEGAAGSGKTTTLRTTQTILARQGGRLVVVTPTLKAAQVAATETGADGRSAAWLIYQHGWRWDTEGHWTRIEEPDRPTVAAAAQLRGGDLLLIDEAGMLDQDTATALLTIADETGARVAFLGDRHQLPAIGRGGVLDHAITWAHPRQVVSMDKVHRFADPGYAALSLRMRDGHDPGGVFDELHRRGQIVLHATDVERTAALAELGAAGDLVIAERREQVADLNAAIRDHRRLDGSDKSRARDDAPTITTAGGEQIGLGDRVATRRNDPDLQVTNRQTWTVTSIGTDGSLALRSHDHASGRRRNRARDRAREHQIPAAYAQQHVELAYATTVHGTQGSTATRAHVALTEGTSAAVAYVAMTRGREGNTAHLVAESLDKARQQWIDTFSRDRSDLGPAQARRRAQVAIDAYGTQPRRPAVSPTASREASLGL